MLIKAFGRLVLFVGPFVIIWYMFVFFDGRQYAEEWSEIHFTPEKLEHMKPKEPDQVIQQDPFPQAQEPAPQRPAENPPPSTQESDKPDTVPHVVDAAAYREVFSASAADKKYFSINFGPGHPAINPNIIPHPTQDNTWIIVAQAHRPHEGVFQELVCNAVFQPDGSLACSTPPTVLPVAPTSSQKCFGKLDVFDLSSGPHDMRVFYGPDAPYAIYGSQSAHTCFGQFTQDFRSLHHSEFGLDAFNAQLFAAGTELQRPQPWGEIEKNWFMFWDAEMKPYVHHDIAPKRVFAQLLPDGSVGPDLAPNAALNDDACMQRYMPRVAPEDESIHQATNALAVTMCPRSDTNCVHDSANTFILTIIQHKRFVDYHATYEPYVVLTQSVAPFAIHAISTKPIWIHGRGALTRESAARYREPGARMPQAQTEMLYLTSINWKERGVNWRGNVDDIVIIGFGIEDERTGGVDVRVGDLLQDLSFCMA